MYAVIVKILRHRLVSICGANGFGKTSVALAVANYISEHRYVVLFVRMCVVMCVLLCQLLWSSSYLCCCLAFVFFFNSYFREGVFFLSLSRATSLREMLSDMARDLHVGEASEDAILSSLQRRQCLLVRLADRQ